MYVDIYATPYAVFKQLMISSGSSVRGVTSVTSIYSLGGGVTSTSDERVIINNSVSLGEQRLFFFISVGYVCVSYFCFFFSVSEGRECIHPPPAGSPHAPQSPQTLPK